ncbi:MAG TPA: arginine--tRNA ligase [Candidatus Saccharimonadales bacterium]|nr:arginine--tRNA ligase [Candidatus Saccharimonadales bacterium]
MHKDLESQLRKAVPLVLPDANLAAVHVRPCPDPRFGDYQTTSLMNLAKERKMNPRQLATDVLAKLDVTDLCDKVEIAGAGFLNFRIKLTAVEKSLESANRGEHLFFQKASSPRSIVVDFSSPNVAKPMHVGHIRSTILGDSLARTLRLLGHRVITDNHIGDWGTQFGMLLIGWKNDLDRGALNADPISELERLYKKVNAQCEEDPGMRELAKLELVQLQQGGTENRQIWDEMIRLSQKQFDAIYGRLGVKFDHTYGESFYNPRLQKVVDELMALGLARESEGAKAIFSDGKLPPKVDPFLIQRDGEWQPNPALIQKSDGGFNYTTTDLATLQFRLEQWNPDEIIYVTDGRQQLHFQQLFQGFRRWHPEASAKLAHVWFGSILGEDGKPFKTRSGETVKLADLLDEAEERALKVVQEKSPGMLDEQKREIARVVGIGAVKYADLLPNRQSDYVFSWEKMLSLEGNTVPYLLYAYARIRSIFRKGGESAPSTTAQVKLVQPHEINLAKKLLIFGITLEAAVEEYRPNFLCNYLYEVAKDFSGFFENCTVLKAEPEERASRLVLCDLTARVLRQGLEVLGIEVLEQM